MSHKSFAPFAFAVYFIISGCGSPEHEKGQMSKQEIEVESQADIQGFDYDKESEWTKTQQAYTFMTYQEVTPEQIDNVDSRKIFSLYCTPCHGINGKMTSLGAKDLTSSTMSKSNVFTQISFGKGTMTPFKGTLSKAELVAVTDYVLELRTEGLD